MRANALVFPVNNNLVADNDPDSVLLDYRRDARRSTKGNGMPVHNSKPLYPGNGTKLADPDVYAQSGFGENNAFWQDLDDISIGYSNGPQVLAANGYANTSVSIALQAAVPNDYASINISLGNIVNLNAWANAAAAGSVTSTAASQGVLTLTNGKLSGLYTASLSIDVTATVAADNATIHMSITDTFQLCLSGTGYVGASLTEISASGATLLLATPGAGSAAASACGPAGQFNLAKFAASVLNTGQWNIAFQASAPGESLTALGSSVLSIAATADIAGPGKPEVLSFHDTDRSTIAFSDNSTIGHGMPYGLQICNPNSVSLFHNA